MNTKPHALVKHKFSLRLPKYMIDYLTSDERKEKAGHLIEYALTTVYNLRTPTEQIDHDNRQSKLPLEP